MDLPGSCPHRLSDTPSSLQYLGRPRRTPPCISTKVKTIYWFDYCSISRLSRSPLCSLSILSLTCVSILLPAYNISQVDAHRFPDPFVRRFSFALRLAPYMLLPLDPWGATGAPTHGSPVPTRRLEQLSYVIQKPGVCTVCRLASSLITIILSASRILTY